MFGLGKLGKLGRVGGVRTTLASILSKYSGSHLWDFGVSADKVAAGAGMTAAQFLAAYPNHNLYQDSAGTTPAFLPTHPVGLCLDQPSGSVVLGAELYTTATAGIVALNANGTIYIASDTITATCTTNGAFGIICAAVTGSNLKSYRISIRTVSESVVSRKYIDFGGASGLDDATTGQAFSFVAPVNTPATPLRVYKLGATAGDTFAVQVTSVKEVLGSHAAQSTTTKRPVLSARVNQLVATEDFSNAAWETLIGGTGSVPVKTPGFTDPNGGNTAFRIQCNRGAGNTGADYSILRQSVNLTGTAPQALTMWVKSNTGSNQTFNLSTGSGLLVTATTAWTKVAGQISTLWRFDVGNYGPDATTSNLDILVWHPDMRPANSPTNLPAYQRVTTSTDYDLTGFPLRAVWDGVDDCLVVPTLDLSITDKVTVVAGVQKVGTASSAALLEFTGNPDSTAGAFSFNAPGGGADTFYASARGATANATKSPTGYAAPVSAVLLNKADLSAATSIATNTLNINGTTVATAGGGAAPGGGNFASAGLYIGQRNGSTYPFSGAIQSITLIPALITASETAVIEASVNNSMGRVY